MSVAPLSTSTNKLTAVPDNLDSFSKDELVCLLKRVAEERNDLKNKKAKVAVVAAAAVAPAVAAPPFNVVATKKRIASAAVRAIKASAHNRQKKPWSLVSESLPNVAAAMALFEGIDVASDSARLIKWVLHDGDAIVQWLGTNNRYVRNVKFDGLVKCFQDDVPEVYEWAGYETLEAKFEKKTGLLSLKIRTYLVGSGIPSGSEDSPPILYPKKSRG